MRSVKMFILYCITQTVLYGMQWPVGKRVYTKQRYKKYLKWDCFQNRYLK